MDSSRVVITGIGIVNSLGDSLDEFGNAIFGGKSGIVPLEKSVISDKRYCLGGQIKDFDFQKAMPDMPNGNGKRFYRYSQFALVASDRAVKDAKLNIPELQRNRIGVSFGTAAGSAGENADESQRFFQQGEKGVSPISWSEMTWSACTSHVANHFGFCGPSTCFTTGCVTSSDTIFEGVRQLREGNADVMLVGGTDCPFHPFVWSMMCRSGLLSPAPGDGGNIPRPFSHDHNGMTVSEGACALILETETHARLRGARIYGEYLGGASTNSGSHNFDIDEMINVFTRVFEVTLRDAGIPPTDIDWICAHGTGHVHGDYTESKGIEKIFGQHAFRIPVSSIRGAIGQPFASGGGLQTAIACLAIKRQEVPPTINFSIPAEGCRLDYVPNFSRVSRVRRVLINAAGVGGIYTSMVIGAYAPEIKQ